MAGKRYFEIGFFKSNSSQGRHFTDLLKKKFIECILEIASNPQSTLRRTMAGLGDWFCKYS